MTLLNAMGLLALAALAAGCARLLLRARRALRDADGLGEVVGESDLDDGEIVGSVGSCDASGSRRPNARLGAAAGGPRERDGEGDAGRT